METKLIKLLHKDGLTDQAAKLESMRDDILGHRIASTLADNSKAFLRNNCGNDAYISKWRKDIDGFDILLSKALKKIKLLPEHAIELKYEGQLLKHQARASLPYTGYYNPLPKTPSIKPGANNEPAHDPQFEYKPAPDRPEILRLLRTTPMTATKLSSFL